MALTYKRCWSRQQIRDAKAFIIAHAESIADNIPGFCDQATTNEAMALMSPEHLIYTVACDGDAVVAVHAVQEYRGEREPGHKYEGITWGVAVYTADPTYDHIPLFWNMMQLLARDVMAEGDGWATTVAAGPAVEYLLTLPWADRAGEPQVDDRGVAMQTVFGVAQTPRAMVEVARV